MKRYIINEKGECVSVYHDTTIPVPPQHTYTNLPPSVIGVSLYLDGKWCTPRPSSDVHTTIITDGILSMDGVPVGKVLPSSMKYDTIMLRDNSIVATIGDKSFSGPDVEETYNVAVWNSMRNHPIPIHSTSEHVNNLSEVTDSNVLLSGFKSAAKAIVSSKFLEFGFTIDEAIIAKDSSSVASSLIQWRSDVRVYVLSVSDNIMAGINKERSIMQLVVNIPKYKDLT